MKLSRVNLAKAMFIGRKHTAELVAETDGELTGDLTSRTVRVGNQIIPFEAVNSMTQSDPGEVCPECKAEGVDKKLIDLRALGAHRRHAHGVKGGGGEVERA